jgi:hypothetical protein
MADIENTFQLIEAFFFGIKIGVLPIQRVTRGRLKIAFCGHE